MAYRALSIKYNPIRMYLFFPCFFLTLSLSISHDMKVVVTRILPPESQALLEAQQFDLVQWQQDCVMPREELLKQVKGKVMTPLICYASPC